MILRFGLMFALLVTIVGCGDPGAPAYLSGDASCVGAKIYADEKVIGGFEEFISPTTAEKSAVARGLSYGYENVPKIPSGAKRVRVVHPDGRELSTAVPPRSTELYGGASFDKMTFDLS